MRLTACEVGFALSDLAGTFGGHHPLDRKMPEYDDTGWDAAMEALLSDLRTFEGGI
jgi:hypothetical protein